MSTVDRYAVPTSTTDWEVKQQFHVHLPLGVRGRPRLAARASTRRARRCSGTPTTRIDWSQDLDPENPEQLPDESIPIFGSRRLGAPDRERRRRTCARHFQAWQLSQFLHGEQGALVCTAKIVQQVPSIDAKFYAATQVMDEARHVEAYSRLLHEKFELAYPITPTLQAPARRRAHATRAGT